jgi:hypothetical protein
MYKLQNPVKIHTGRSQILDVVVKNKKKTLVGTNLIFFLV